jgi:hypothetical protein
MKREKITYRGQMGPIKVGYEGSDSIALPCDIDSITMVEIRGMN